jgi:LysM repeat protein
MKALRDLLVGLITSAAVALFVLGGFSLTLVESATVQPSAQPSPSATASPWMEEPLPTNLTEAPSVAAPSQTPTEITVCDPSPKGWQPYNVQPGDRLSELIQGRTASLERVIAANCLPGEELMSEITIYLPPLKPSRTPTKHAPKDTEMPDTATPTRTKVAVTPVACGAPHGWVTYRVRSGDTLYKIAWIHYTDVSSLQSANCLGNSTTIYIGQSLYVPNIYTRTPTPTQTEWVAPPTPHKTPTRTPDSAATQTAQAVRQQTAAAKTAEAAAQKTANAAAQQTLDAAAQKTAEAAAQQTANAAPQQTADAAAAQTAEAAVQQTAAAAVQQTADAAATQTAEAVPPAGGDTPPSGLKLPADWLTQMWVSLRNWLAFAGRSTVALSGL